MSTTTTNLNVTLSATLQTDLSQPGVWAYAVYFDTNGVSPEWTELVTNGVVADSGTVTIVLTEPYVGGKIYFIIQSQSTSQPNNLETLITSESDLTWSNAITYDFRYDSFEVSLENSPSDVGNLTSINGFGLPLAVNVGASSVGYAISAADLVADIQKINTSNTYTYDYESGPLSGNFRAPQTYF